MKKIITLLLVPVLFLFTTDKVIAQAANDDCAGAISVTPDGTCVAGTTVAANDGWTGTVGCQAGGGTHEDVWYTFVATGTVYTGTVTGSAPWAGNVEFTLVSSTGGCAGPFTLEGSACGASPLAINIPGLTNGATYYFTISNSSAGTSGPFQVCSTTSSPPANCTDNDDCLTPQIIAYVAGVQTCLNDCNTGALPGPEFAGNNCFDFPNSTVWYQVTTGATSASIDIALTSAVLTNPYFTVFTTPDCNTYTSVNCTQGAAGSASANVSVSASTTYLIAISDQAGAAGNFDLCITVNNDNSACNTTNSLTVSATSMGSPLTGPFKPGEIVTFCYSITNWQQINCNYLQGIVPTFGDCWDPVSMDAQGKPLSIPTPLVTAGTIQPCPPGPPCPWSGCVGTPDGTWSWFPAGAVTYNAIGGSLPDNTPMPAGWYFLSSYNPLTGACTGGDPTDPDDSYGDSNFNLCAVNTLDWTVCFQLQTRGVIACTNGQTDCAVKVNTYADGEIGVWGDIGCTADATGAAFVAASLCCTAVPTVTSPVTYCINDVAVPLTATGSNLLWYTTATGGVGSAVAPTPSTTTVGSTNYYVSSMIGGCESARVIITVTINPDATITLSSAAATTSQTLCINTAITNITYTVAGGGTGAGVIGLPAGVAGSFVGGVFTISGTPTASGTFNYTVTTTGTCTQAAAIGTITVNPNATITLSSAAATTSQTLCINTAITNITYTVADGGTGAGVAGLPAGVTGSFVGGVFTISGTPTASGTFNYTVTTTGTCTQATAIGTITVNPNATIVLSSAVGTNAQTVCINTAITNITYTVAGGGTGAGVAGLPAGVTGSFVGGVFTISGTPTATGVYNYTITTTGICNQTTAIGTITVNPDATITLSSAVATTSQTLCVNTAITNITYTVAGGGTGAGVAGLPAGVTGSFVAGVFTISGTPSASGIFNYTVTTTGTCTQASAIGTITVTPMQSAAFSYSGSTFCQTGADPSPVITGTPGGTFTFVPAGLIIDANTGAITLATSALNTYTVTYTTAGPCPANSSVSVTITDAPSAVFSYASPYCQGGTNPSPTFGAGASAGTFSSTPGLVFVSTSTGQVNLATSTPGTYTVTNDIIAAGGCSAATATSTITIDPLPVATFSYTGTPYCQNSANAFPTYSGGGVAGTFSSTLGLVFVSTATGEVDLAASTAGIYTVTNTIAAGGVCPAVTATSTITITTLPVATFSYTNTPYCQNAANPSPTFSGGGVAGTFSSTPGLVFVSTLTGEVDLPGSTTGTYIVTNTIAAASGCPIVTETASLVVNPLDDASFSYSSSTYCQTSSNPTPVITGVLGGVFTVVPAGISINSSTGTIDLAASSLNTYTITYTTPGPCIDSATFDITITSAPSASFSYAGPYCQTGSPDPLPVFGAGATGGSFSSTVGLTLNSITGQITLASSTAGTYTVTNTIAAAGGCAVASAASSVIIDQPATAYAGVDSAICSGTDYITAASIGGSAASLTWSTTGTGSFGNINAASTNYTPSSSDSTAGSIMLIVTSDNPIGACNAVADTMILTINALPNVDAGAIQILSCTTLTATLNGVSTSAGAAFSWSGPGIVSGGNTAAPIVNAVGTYTLTVNSGSCSNTDTVSVFSNTIVPNAEAGSIQTLTCVTLSTSLAGTSTTAGATFSWAGAGIVSGGNTAAPLVNVSGIYTLTVTDPSNGCSATDTVSVLSNTNAPDANAGSGQTLTCTATTVNLNASSLTAGVTYSWAGPGIVSGGASATPTVNAAGTYTVTVTNPSNGCTATSTVIVSSNTTPPIADAGAPQGIGCGILNTTLNGNGSSAGASFSYSWTTTTGNIVSGGTTTQPVVDLGGIYTIIVTNTTNGCTATDTVSVSQAPTPVASFTANPTTGSHPLTVNFTNTSQNSNSYIWNFGDGSAPVSVINPTDIYNNSGTYIVTLIASNNSQCPDTAQITIIVYDDFSIMIPNIFTPNADGKNDIFKVTSTGIENLDGAIYDRWGAKIFEWHGVSGGWDGRTSAGIASSDGTYYYILTVKASDTKEHVFNGYLQLLR